ncbi:MAG: hypothetical protein ACLULK_03920 [Anaerovoracaceae bacterium]
MKRPIDISKKSNKKCEHCENWTGWETMQCKLNGEKKNYWNRCREFSWKKGLDYIDSAVKKE